MLAMRVRGDAAGESREMKHLCVSHAERETGMEGTMQGIIHFNWSVVSELVSSYEVHVNLKWLVVQKVSVRDGRLSVRLSRFNAASLPTNLSQLTKVLSHCV